jgi:signal transduction histidine kinase
VLYLEVVKYFEDKGDKVKTAEIKFQIGRLNYYTSRYENALKSYQEAAKLYRDLGNDQKVAKVFQNIGIVYTDIPDYEKALEYYQKALVIDQQANNLPKIAALYQNIGIVYYNWGNYSRTIQYYNKSLSIFNRLNNQEGIATTSNNIGLVYEVMENYSRALDYYKQALDRFHKIDYKRGIILAGYNVGSAYRHLKNFNKSLAYYDSSLRMARELGFKYHMRDTYQSLADVYTDMDDHQQALRYFKLYTQLKDSLNEVESTEDIHKLEAKFNLDLKESELAKKNAELKYQRYITYSLIIGGLLLLVVTIFMYIAYRQKKKAKTEIEGHRDALEKLVKKRTEELQVEINERRTAEESDRLKSAFLANMSHEIRTPMNAIVAFSEFLKDPEITQEKRNEFINHITSCSSSLLQLIDDIIDSAKIEAKQLKITKETFEVGLILKEIFAIYSKTKLSRGKNNIELRINMADGERPLYIKSDLVRFKQIFSNLLDNAFKYTDRGFIEFGYREPLEGFIPFYVRDSGIGISPKKHELVFERFGQADNSISRSYGGTGLGLNICKNLVELLGGNIWVESEPGKGALFIFTLPYQRYNGQSIDKEEKLSNQAKIDLEHFDWQNFTILVAEDDDLNYRVIELALKKTKAELLRAKNGSEAVEACRTNGQIALVLMDIQMPKMDGYQATKLIKQQRSSLPIIAQTAFAMADEEKKCLQEGCDDYISKPIKIESLLIKLKKFLN